MEFHGPELTALILATSFAAGLNVYATVGTMGLLGRYDMLVLPDSLHLVTSWWVIAICGVMFAIEFFADKIPLFDLFWNALHTFVRVPVAAALAYGATSHLSPQMQLLSGVAGGAIALIAHGGKTAARAAVTASPEPVSNIALSLGEDTLAVFLTWFASQHPYWSAGIAVAGIIIIFLLMKIVVASLVKLLHEAGRQIKAGFSPRTS